LPERILNSFERNIWNLVVRRFMAAFGDPAMEQTVKATVSINGDRFLLEGRETLEDGWIRFYQPYANSMDVHLPPMVAGQEVNVEKIASHDEFTRPPPRYNPGSLLKRMQKENLGTKATRAGIIQTLYDRKYIAEERMVVSNLGFEVVAVLQKHCPTVLSSKMTAGLEEKMSEIQEKKETRQNVVNGTIETLKPIIEKLKEKEAVIGEQLSHALQDAELEKRTVGACPACKTGKLIIIYSRKSSKRFVGCTNYFTATCKTAFPLPQKGGVKPLGTNCKSCGSPTVRVWMRGKRSWKLCLNPECPLKKGGSKRK
jgi:DNA topoisomerase-1